MGASGIITGLFLKLQENDVLSVLLDNWAATLTFWAVLSLILSLLLNFIVFKEGCIKRHKPVLKYIEDYDAYK